MNGEDKLFRGNLSDAEMNSLSREELALWVMRPTKSVVAEARAWMKVRVALLIVATIYYTYAYRISAEQGPLLFFLFCVFHNYVN